MINQRARASKVKQEENSLRVNYDNLTESRSQVKQAAADDLVLALMDERVPDNVVLKKLRELVNTQALAEFQLMKRKGTKPNRKSKLHAVGNSGEMFAVDLKSKIKGEFGSICKHAAVVEFAVGRIPKPNFIVSVVLPGNRAGYMCLSLDHARITRARQAKFQLSLEKAVKGVGVKVQGSETCFNTYKVFIQFAFRLSNADAATARCDELIHHHQSIHDPQSDTYMEYLVSLHALKGLIIGLHNQTRRSIAGNNCRSESVSVYDRDEFDHDQAWLHDRNKVSNIDETRNNLDEGLGHEEHRSQDFQDFIMDDSQYLRRTQGNLGRDQAWIPDCNKVSHIDETRNILDEELGHEEYRTPDFQDCIMDDSQYLRCVQGNLLFTSSSFETSPISDEQEIADKLPFSFDGESSPKLYQQFQTSAALDDNLFVENELGDLLVDESFRIME